MKVRRRPCAGGWAAVGVGVLRGLVRERDGVVETGRASSVARCTKVLRSPGVSIERDPGKPPEAIDRAYRIPWEQMLAEPKAAFGIRSETYGPRSIAFEALVRAAAKGFDEGPLRFLQSPGSTCRRSCTRESTWGSGAGCS